MSIQPMDSEIASEDLLASQTLCEVVTHWSQVLPQNDAVVFIDENGEKTALTYEELAHESLRVADQLRSVCEPGQRAVLMFPAGVDFVTAFFGCLFSGVIAVPATYPKPRRRNERLASIAMDCQPRAVLTTLANLQHIDVQTVCPSLVDAKWIAVDDRSAPVDDTVEITRVDQASPAFLQYTSGSTSEPRGVVITHGNLLDNLELIRVGMRLPFNTTGDPSKVGVFWLPAYHDMGLIGGILTPLYLGGTTVLMGPTSFLKRPIRWLQTISEYRALISGAPNFAYDHCVKAVDQEELASLDLSSWEIAFCGAEPIRASTLERFCSLFEPTGFHAESFYPCYGLAEATLMVTGNADRRSPLVKHYRRADLELRHVVEAGPEEQENSIAMVGCGVPLAGAEVVIVDTHSIQPAGSQQIGEIWCRGRSVAHGYWNRADVSREVFEAYLPETGKGPYLRTGDLGFIDDGQLFVTGRIKEVMVVRGRNFYPQDIEATVDTAHDALAISGGIVFSVNNDHDEQIVVVHELERQAHNVDMAEVTRSIRNAILQEHEIDLHAIVLVRPYSLPRTTSGKKQRVECRQLFLNEGLKKMGEWKNQDSKSPSDTQDCAVEKMLEPAPTTSENWRDGDVDQIADMILERMIEWLIEHGTVAREEATPDRPLAEFGLDSLTGLELSTELENWLQIKLNPIVAWNYPTPAELSRYLAEEVTGKEGEHSSNEVIAPANDCRFDDLLAELETMDTDPGDASLGGNGSIK